LITDIDLDPQSGTARSLDLGDRAVAGHVLRLGLELLMRAQIQVSRITLSAVGAAAMAFWVTRCCRSRASVAEVAKREPDVPEAPRVRGGQQLRVGRPYLLRDLAGHARLLSKLGTRSEAPRGHRRARCRSPSPRSESQRRFPCTRTAPEPTLSRRATGRSIDRTVSPVAPHKRPARAVLASPPTCPA